MKYRIISLPMMIMLLLLLLSSSSYHVLASIFTPSITYPPYFMWGSASSAYQIEGAYNQDGRGFSIWDTFTHAGKCRNETGDVADNHYNLLDQDVQLLVNLKLKWYRMSISWTRILPTGRGEVNQPGINHYQQEFNLLFNAGITPFVTLFHWDLPQAIEDDGGWLNNNTITDFINFADICFKNFPRIKNWITLNEPYCTAWLGHGVGVHAPGRCSDRSICTSGNSTTEPYIVAHNLLLAHARVVKLYREKYNLDKSGKIGITLNSDWAEPLEENNEKDSAASERYIMFLLGWFAHPIFLGDYPEVMKEVPNLPLFSDEEIKLINGSSDFFGLNHYTSVYATPATHPDTPGWANDRKVSSTYYRDKVPIGLPSDLSWLYVVPWGFRNLLGWIKNQYNNPPIIVTENGVCVRNESSIPFPDVLQDEFRINYFKSYLNALYQAISVDNVDVRGYFAWSVMDNFEWADGYSVRFGLHYVDYKDLKRYPKASAHFFSSYVADVTPLDSQLWYLAFYAFPGFILLVIVVACLLCERSRNKYDEY